MTTAITSQAFAVSEPVGPPVWLRGLTPLRGLSLLIGALGVVGYRHLSEGVRRDNDRTLAVIAEQKRQQIEGVLADARMDAQLNFASHSQIEDLFGRWIAGGRRDGTMQEWMRRRLVEVAGIRGWGGVRMFDAGAKLALAVGQGSLANEQERILDIIRRPRIELVDLHLDAAGKAHYGILSPIGGAGETPHGVAYISWPADNTLYPQVKSWPVPTQTAETYLVRREGADVRFVTSLRHFERADLGFVQPMSRQDMAAARAARGEYGIISGGRDYRNVPVLAYAVPVAGTPWLMLAEIDEAEAYAAIRAIGWEAGVLVGLGLLLVYSGGFLFWRRARQGDELASRRRYEVELRGAYDAAEAANAAKSEFLAHMSHEIRTPMNAVLGLAQVLQRESLADNQRDMVARIRGAGQSLLNILNDVLDLSKVEAGQLRIEPRPFELSSLLADIDSLMGQAANAKGLTLRIALPDIGADLLLGDGLRLEQVLLNLIGNAIKFADRGEVSLITSCSERNEAGLRLRFEVRDNGIGIAPEALERLFEPFAQADAGISRRYGGTGLGLSICKRLVELMGGQIGATSEPGLGSCFWFELPMLLAQAQAAAAPSGKPVRPLGPCLVGAHLLVVDDSAMNRDLVDRALRQEGARVSLAADGQQAVQILSNRSDAFDGVLMDVQMPVMDGLTAIRVIRDKLGMVDLPIIAFTAGVGARQQAAAREAGANDVLPKPMDLDEMAELLSRWILPRVPAVAQGQGQEPGKDFPDIPGIDRERAAQRLGNDRDIFFSLLDFFIRDNTDAVKHVRAELAAGDREAAGRRMHTLASNAGFLCALDLMDVARQAEAAIDLGELELEPMLDAIAAQVSALVEACQPWRQPA